MILLNKKSDIAWAIDTHLREDLNAQAKSEFKKNVKSLVLYGNEDSPSKIVFYSKKNPEVFENPYATWKPKDF